MACISDIMRLASKLVIVLGGFVFGSVFAGECRQTAYLTFDTGNMAHAQFIADTLRQRNIRATFFLSNTPTYRNDHALDESWRDYWQQRVSEGHVMGNHTWSHYFARNDDSDGRLRVVDRSGKTHHLSKLQWCEELSRVEQQFNKLTGRRMNAIWRAPGGRTTQQSLRWAAQCGYPVHIGWDDAGYIGDDVPSERVSNETLLANALKNIRNGDIVLMHLGIWSRKTPAAPILPRLLDGLEQRGFCFDVIPAGKR